MRGIRFMLACGALRGIRPLLACGVLLLAWDAGAADPLRVVTTVPDLADLIEQVGGDEVEVEALVKGPQDPHFLEPRPSFIRKLHKADLFVLVGMELEVGWAPVLMRQSRNGRIQPGAPGHLNASAAIAPLEAPQATVNRSQGDVHPWGNPHYLTDPLNGLRVARLARDKLEALRPEASAGFRERFAAFEARLLRALVGEAVLERHGARVVFERASAGTLEAFLASKGESETLAGWLGATRPLRGARAIQDHRIWPYFARRFGLVMIDTLEPKPGIAPTTRHLAAVVERARAQGAVLILASPYFDPRHARFVAEQTGARIAEMAHQVGARPGTGDYLKMVDYNVRQVVGAP